MIWKTIWPLSVHVITYAPRGRGVKSSIHFYSHYMQKGGGGPDSMYKGVSD